MCVSVRRAFYLKLVLDMCFETKALKYKQLSQHIGTGDTMAYRKVCDTPLVGEVLHCSEGLNLDWDLDKQDLQEPEPSMEHMQMQHVDCQISDPGPDPDPELMEPIQPSVSVSPHGRFERLQEDPNYISHFTRAPGHKGQRRLHCFLLRYFLGGSAFFILGLVIGWFTHTPTHKLPVPPSDSSDLLEELLRGITADKIKALQSHNFSYLVVKCFL
ncbi:Inactive N-acetylated-alpha-linked acidic dipeptidase-like protein 2 [Channa argus]|uniref:Inactive N-acetylated-alpha-linked acidic dipeptidase-like protein 2 n=1 Tax=Channa argus TaxID=215402 RepID=A0A6G1PMD9_CHAAH|nr:Inactive N-acetylated-alpha-linked acidic dipeptidase-like protein 2 [Channa argus]